MQITPAILVQTFTELKKQLKQVEPIFEYVQLDIMDGIFVDNKSFEYNEDKDLANFFENLEINLKLELHLMVNNPLDEIEKWKNVESVFRIIFHFESKDNITKVINKVRENRWQVGISLNPDTTIDKIIPYLNDIKVLQFMTVTPGKQGNPFRPEIEEKVQKINRLSNKPLISVDGGVCLDNIQMIKNWGVDIFNVGSALMKQNNIEKARDALYNKILK